MGSESAGLLKPEKRRAWLAAQAEQRSRGYMLSTLVLSAAGAADCELAHFSEGKLRPAGYPWERVTNVASRGSCVQGLSG